MPALISPAVSVSIIDESFYPSGAPTTVPLIFIATADEKLQADGITPALGTFEHGVLREVTSLRQSAELYGIPRFLESADGQAHHGDVRNEYGLDALNKFLELGNRAYVIRANVNLADDLESIKTLWSRKIGESADFLNVLVNDYITEYNGVNSLVPADVGYKKTVTGEELKPLLNEALTDVLTSYSFSSDGFEQGFLQSHTEDHAGYQDVLFDTSGGYLQESDITGLTNDSTVYGFEVEVVDSGGTNVVPVTIFGQDAQTFGELILEIQNEIQAVTTDVNTTVELIQGRIRITSGLKGVTSSVEILTDGQSGTTALFANVNLFESFDTPVGGVGIGDLDVYDNTYSTIVGGYDGLYSLIDNWSIGAVVGTEFTADEAEGLLLAASDDFDNTREFLFETSLGANDSERRLEVKTQIQQVINNPDTNIRGEYVTYNVTLAPGFPEASDELIRLSEDLFEEVFVIGETPFDKPPTGPLGITVWSQTPERNHSSYHIAYYYPHGISSNLDGKDIMTSAASTALRVFAYNDLNGELWFAPAGVQRGECPHLTKIGYVSGTLGGPTTFVEDYIDFGTRDSLYESPKDINPITFMAGRGIMVLGQKTSYGASSALDRVNVSRLVKYIKRTLRHALFPYLFDPNDEITRENAKATTDSTLAELISRRGLYDYASLCNETNNTPDRIDRNELWIDVAIKPVKAVEFIYVPVRVVNTGTDIGGREILIG
jgi:hypothetical protein